MLHWKCVEFNKICGSPVMACVVSGAHLSRVCNPATGAPQVSMPHRAHAPIPVPPYQPNRSAPPHPPPNKDDPLRHLHDGAEVQVSVRRVIPRQVGEDGPESFPLQRLHHALRWGRGLEEGGWGLEEEERGWMEVVMWMTGFGPRSLAPASHAA